MGSYPNMQHRTKGFGHQGTRITGPTLFLYASAYNEARNAYDKRTNQGCRQNRQRNERGASNKVLRKRRSNAVFKAGESHILEMHIPGRTLRGSPNSEGKQKYTTHGDTPRLVTSGTVEGKSTAFAVPANQPPTRSAKDGDV